MAYRISLLDACMDAWIECDEPDEALDVLEALGVHSKDDTQKGSEEQADDGK